MTVFVGTSGWQYRDWRGAFYPRDVAQRHWLPHYAARFQTVEVNNSFYRLPSRETFEAWAEAVPANFVFALKASRFLTHIKRLRDPEEPVERFLRHAAPLGDRKGPVLLQLPPTMRAEPERLDATLALLAPRVRVAVEVRHESWHTDRVRAVLERHDAALVLADRGSRPLEPLWRTASWGYVRLHEGRATPRPCYGRGALAGWARRISDCWPASADVYVYFNNDPGGCAVNDARRFALAAERAGLAPTRVPAAREVLLAT